jgi:hypothetical protein
MNRIGLSQQRCAPYVQTLAARDFVAELQRMTARKAAHFPWADLEVVGPVVIPAGRLPHGLVLERIFFTDRVSMAGVHADSALRFQCCVFDRGLALPQSTVKGGLWIENCRFGIPDRDNKAVQLDLKLATVSGNVRLVRTEIHGILSARGSRVRGTVSFTGCTVEGDTAAVEVEAVVDLVGIEVSDGVQFEMEVSNDATRSPSEVLKNLREGNTASHTRSLFRDRAARESVCLRDAKVDGIVYLRSARFEGSVSLQGLRTGSVHSDGWFYACRPDEIVQWELSREGIFCAEIKGDLDFSKADIGYIMLRGISVTGRVKFIDGKSGQIQFDDWSFVEAASVFIVPARCGAFWMSAWHCRDYLYCNFEEIGGKDGPGPERGVVIQSSHVERNLTFWPGRRREDSPEYVIEAGDRLVAVQVLGRSPTPAKLRDISTAPALRPLVHRWRRRMRIFGKLSIARCAIGGDIVMVALDVVDPSGWREGRIEVLDTEVKGAFRCPSPQSYLADPQNDDPFLRKLAICEIVRAQISQAQRSAPRDEHEIPVTTECDAVDLRRIVATDVDLSGLTVREPPSQRATRRARVDLDYARIQRQLTLSAVIDRDTWAAEGERLQDYLGGADILAAFAESTRPDRFVFLPARGQLLKACLGPKLIRALAERLQAIDMWRGGASFLPTAHARIPGAIDLQHASIGEIRLSDASFREALSGERADEVGVVLDFAEIRRLHVLRGARDRGHNGFPAPVSLLDCRVRTWFLQEDEARWRAEPEHETTRAEPFLDFLDNDPEFRMSSYAAVGKSLLDRGLDEEAVRVLVAGRYRDQRTGHKSPLEPLWRRLGMAQSPSWRPGDGRYRRHARWLPAWRLRRPWREARALATCALWALFTLWAASGVVAEPTSIWTWTAFIGALLLAFFMLREPMRLAIDRLYWSLVDYGTSATRLLFVIVSLMFLTFVFVAGDPRNIDATILASSLAVQKQSAARTAAYAEVRAESAVDGEGHPTAANWGLAERLWTTLRFHIPMVDAVVADEWQPSDGPLHMAGLAEHLQREQAPGWWAHVRHAWPGWWPLRLSGWPRARDWFAVMQWVNWVLWPLFLPFLLRKVTREKS